MLPGVLEDTQLPAEENVIDSERLTRLGVVSLGGEFESSASSVCSVSSRSQSSSSTSSAATGGGISAGAKVFETILGVTR